jgi:hypothetical protein
VDPGLLRGRDMTLGGQIAPIGVLGDGDRRETHLAVVDGFPVVHDFTVGQVDPAFAFRFGHPPPLKSPAP